MTRNVSIDLASSNYTSTHTYTLNFIRLKLNTGLLYLLKGHDVTVVFNYFLLYLNTSCVSKSRTTVFKNYILRSCKKVFYFNLYIYVCINNFLYHLCIINLFKSLSTIKLTRCNGKQIKKSFVLITKGR